MHNPKAEAALMSAGDHATHVLRDLEFLRSSLDEHDVEVYRHAHDLMVDIAAALALLQLDEQIAQMSRPA